MKAKEVIDKYLDPEKISSMLRKELEDMISREKPFRSPDLMNALYGDEKGDLELAQLRAELLKTQTEAEECVASAVRDRAQAQSLMVLSRRRSGR